MQICFKIYILNNEESKAERTEQSIAALHVPASVKLVMARINTLDVNQWREQLKQAACESCYEYKMYVWAGVIFVNVDVIRDILCAFDKEDKIGAIGLTGARYACKYKSKIVFDGKAIGTQTALVDGAVFITHYRMNWWYDLLPDWKQAMAAQCLGYIRNGYKLFVPKQPQAWCIVPDILDKDINGATMSSDFWTNYAGYLEQCKDGGTDVVRLLKGVGTNTVIGAGFEYNKPEAILFGEYVRIGRNIRLHIDGENDSDLAVYIGDHAIIGNGSRIDTHGIVKISQYVRIGDGVVIRGNVSVGFCTEIEDNVIVKNAKIGNGCLIKKGSIVENDIPHHCKAEGCPAQVTEMLDYSNGTWIIIKDEAELVEKMTQRESIEPIFSIGIPTYNRGLFLEKNLHHIYDAIGDDDLFSVLISDNGSDDGTKEIGKKFSDSYKKCFYCRHETGHNGQENFRYVWENSPGRFVLALGDDIYLNPRSIYKIIETLYHNEKINIVGIRDIQQKNIEIINIHTMGEYLDNISYWTTHISNYIFRRDVYKKIPFPTEYRWLAQVDIQMTILKNSKESVIMKGIFFDRWSGEQGNVSSADEKNKTGLGKVFISQYLTILGKYLDEGLDFKVFNKEKKTILEEYTIPSFESITKKRDSAWTIDHNILDICEKYYGQEDYYKEDINKIKNYIQIMSYQKRWHN